MMQDSGGPWDRSCSCASSGEQTLRYVRVTSAHRRPLPKKVLPASRTDEDPRLWTLAKLGAPGSAMAVVQKKTAETLMVSAVWWCERGDSNPTT